MAKIIPISQSNRIKISGADSTTPYSEYGYETETPNGTVIMSYDDVVKHNDFIRGYETDKQRERKTNRKKNDLFSSLVIGTAWYAGIMLLVFKLAMEFFA